MSACIWVNGTRQSPVEPHVSAFDRGLTLADGVFETMRAIGGTVFRLERHLERIGRGLDVLEIGPPSEASDWATVLQRRVSEAVGAAEMEDARVRLMVTRGIGAPGLVPTPGASPSVIVTVTPRTAPAAGAGGAGVAALVASGRRNEHAATAGLKTLAFTEAVAALLEARRAGLEEAIFLDTAGHCCEATTSNLFAWTDDRLVTPPLSCGPLPGITRAVVLEIARSLGVPADERELSPEELLASDEAFLTSSLRGIAPLVRVGDRAIGRGAPGALTRQLADAYTALVLRECREG